MSRRNCGRIYLDLPNVSYVILKIYSFTGELLRSDTYNGNDLYLIDLSQFSNEFHTNVHKVVIR